MRKKHIMPIILLLLVLFEPIWVDILSIRVEAELDALCDYSELYYELSPLEVDKWEFYLFHDYGFNGGHYLVSPIGGCFWDGLVSFQKKDYKVFPDDLMKSLHWDSGDFYLPKSEYRNKENWDIHGYTCISFDRAYSLEEITEKLNVEHIRWLWVDTYGDDFQESPTEICRLPIDGSMSNAQGNIEEFLALLNKYDRKTKTKVGREIYKARQNIKKEGEIQAEDLRIIGCVLYPTEEEVEEFITNDIYKDMFKVINY